MSDPHYPLVDIEFMKHQVLASGKLAKGGIVKIRETTIFILAGQQAINKRIIMVRELGVGEIGLEQATGVAFRFTFLNPLFEWLEINKNWKEGGYIKPKEATVD